MYAAMIIAIFTAGFVCNALGAKCGGSHSFQLTHSGSGSIVQTQSYTFDISACPKQQSLTTTVAHSSKSQLEVDWSLTQRGRVFESWTVTQRISSVHQTRSVNFDKTKSKEGELDCKITVPANDKVTVTFDLKAASPSTPRRRRSGPRRRRSSDENRNGTTAIGEEISPQVSSTVGAMDEEEEDEDEESAMDELATFESQKASSTTSPLEERMVPTHFTNATSASLKASPFEELMV